MIFVKISQNIIKSPLKICLISQKSDHSLWHVCELIKTVHRPVQKLQGGYLTIIKDLFSRGLHDNIQCHSECSLESPCRDDSNIRVPQHI